ncbi:MAG: CinA family nicotinamide mononucleotide deamidase-related protein [Paludibacteraceae bacterium]|nr:CinA family nicotinamide mononucleotide deamidase-related protein [Paludibacteraceae bacterium]
MEKTMRAEIITIGDELLIGQVVDTNSAWMAQKLNEHGIELYQITSVHDDREHIIAAVDGAFKRADIVLTTGGLGPTKDDITKQVLCEYFRTRLIEDGRVREHIYDLYKDRPDVLNKLTATQWMVPEHAVILPNRVGSAPLMVFPHGPQLLASMPGVPYEMKIAMEEQILPYISRQYAVISGRDSVSPIMHKTLQVSGIAESTLAILLEQYENEIPSSIHLAYLPKDGIIRLRLSSYGEMTEEEMNLWYKRLKTLVSEYLIAETDEPLEVIVGKMLQAQGATISTAESCTGGKLASLLNKHAGSSAFYWGSVVSYDNSVKQHVLGVPERILETYGAVSEETVCIMANNVRKQMNTTYAIATSGIAGPSGGTAEKPVGTVWIAWATPEGTTAECFHLGKLREQITDRACTKALIGLLRMLQVRR